MSADSPRRTVRGVPAIVPPQVVNDRSIIDSVAGFINDVTLTNQIQLDPKDTITWAKFETAADISDPTFGEDWELEGNAAPPLLLILGYGLGVQVWAIPANGEAIEVLSWRHGNITALRILPTPISADIAEMTDEPVDQFAEKRPLMAICEGAAPGCNSQYYSINFTSLKDGSHIKVIKFKNPVIDILANRTSVVITFPERIAVFDARTLEDRLSVTTCYPSPGINPNPVALGARWIAYSENKLIHSKRSGAGCDGDGVSSYTATVLNAAKSLGKGLRELGEQVAAGLTGASSYSSSGSSSKTGSFDSTCGDIKQPGVVTILDIKYAIKDVSPTTGSPISITGNDPMVAHFIAHTDAIVAMEFDYSGMLLLTADRRGHDFHVFRIQPHPAGCHLAAVHHLYILHRGDTSAKVQNIAFSMDSRWVAISTLRGTTHVFPITPYGGPAGFRTHTSLHVVNRLSRFHRSAGLSPDGRSSSPISSHSESSSFNQACMPYNNPTIPPFPRPHIIPPLAQLRQPFVLGSPPGSAQNSYSRSSHNRQRLSSLSDDNGKPLSVCAIFAKARSWLLDLPNLTRDTPAYKMQKKAVDSLFIMDGHGTLIQYDLDTKLASNVAKEKVCDDTPIELEVEAKAQWNLTRKETSIEIQPPLSSDNWLIKESNSIGNMDSSSQSDDSDDRGERGDRWLSQVEIITHAGPHRRLWMGPQFVFKTYNTPSGSSLSHIDTEAVEIGVSAATTRPGRSSPMNMPISSTAGRSAVPVLIESGSYSSIEQSPKLMDRFRHEHLDSDFSVAHGESRLKEDLADAMRESPSVQHKDTGLTLRVRHNPQMTTEDSKIVTTISGPPSSSVTSSSSQSAQVKVDRKSSAGENNRKNFDKILDDDENDEIKLQKEMKSALAQKTKTTSIDSERENSSCTPAILIEKIVNPLGTVTTRTISPSDNEHDPYDPYHQKKVRNDPVIHENCDETLFRPIVAIFCDEEKSTDALKSGRIGNRRVENTEKPPEPIGTELIVPVIEKEKNDQTTANKKKSNKYKTENKNVFKSEDKEKSPNLEKCRVRQNRKDNENENKEKCTLKNEIDEISPPKNISKLAEKASFDFVEIQTNKKKSKNSSRKGSLSDKERTPPLPCSSTSSSDASDKTIKEKVEIIHKVKERKSSLETTKKQITQVLPIESVRNKEEAQLEITLPISKKERSKSKKDDDNEISRVSAKDGSSTQNVERKEKIFKSKAKPKSLSHTEKDKGLYRVSSDPIVYETKTAIEDEESPSTAMDFNFKLKRDKKEKQASAELSQLLKKEEEAAVSGELKFYEKFGSGASENVQLDVNFVPNLISSDNSGRKKKKSKNNSPNLSTPQQSPKLSSKQFHQENKVEDQKNPEDTKSTASFTIVTKKRKDKKSTEEKSIKKTSDIEKTSTIPLDMKGATSFVEPKTLNKLSKDIPEIDHRELDRTVIKNEKEDEMLEKALKNVSEFPRLSFDFTDTYLPPLSPLEPFESKFENLNFKERTKSNDDNVSLINFESPLQEKKSLSALKRDEDYFKVSKVNKRNDNDKLKDQRKRWCSKDNLILALCDSLEKDAETEDKTVGKRKTKEKKKYVVEKKSDEEELVTNDDDDEDECESSELNDAPPLQTKSKHKQYSKCSVKDSSDNSSSSIYKSFTESGDQYLSFEKSDHDSAVIITTPQIESRTTRVSKEKTGDKDNVENTKIVTSSSSSSEETEETTTTSCNLTISTKKKKSRNHHLRSSKSSSNKLTDDDEELRPLIGGANSACSMASSSISVGGKKEEDIITSSSSSIALEIAKAIIDTTLPDSSNQSDSSDQANISEPGESEDTGNEISYILTKSDNEKYENSIILKEELESPSGFERDQSISTVESTSIATIGLTGGRPSFSSKSSMKNTCKNTTATNTVAFCSSITDDITVSTSQVKSAVKMELGNVNSENNVEGTEKGSSMIGVGNTGKSNTTSTGHTTVGGSGSSGGSSMSIAKKKIKKRKR